MDIRLQKPYCSEYINVAINVSHSYFPQLTSVTRHKHSNMHRIAGFIKYSNNTNLPNVNVPVVIKMLDEVTEMEEVTVTSKKRFFSYDIYPYSNGKKEYQIVSDIFYANIIF